MHYQRNCKICKSDYAKVLLFMNHCNAVPYTELIEKYEKYISRLNLYNISTHFNRHVEQKDILEVEALKKRFDQERHEALEEDV